MLCPRCDDDKSTRISIAPADGSWELYRCGNCDFVWRSTEREEIRDGRLYPPEFKLSEEQIAKMAVKPALPPLRKSGKQ